MFKAGGVCNNMGNINAVFLFSILSCSTCMAMIITIIFLFNHHYANFIFNPGNVSLQTNKENERMVEKSCDLSEGRWIPDRAGPLYTNYSCKTLPLSKNCLLNGRQDRDFLYWRWKPNQCELPRFEPQTFLSILRGKNMAFVGDSLARNHMESLLCLLSTVETPNSIEGGAEDRFTIWEFPKHNFTLMALWSRFLVAATSIVVNGTDTGSFDLHLDRADPSWSEKLPSLDYAILSTGHWFIRQNNLYEGGKLIGCTFCSLPNVTSFEPGFAVRKAIRATFRAVEVYSKKMSSFFRTYSPTHFENGEWNTGGRCNRTGPVERSRVQRDWDLRRDQIEEAEMLMKSNDDSKFGVVDVTEMMWERADGHPDLHWMKMNSRWKSGYRDCAHWCLPGPIDTWSALLLEMIKKKQRLTTSSEK